MIVSFNNQNLKVANIARAIVLLGLLAVPARLAQAQQQPPVIAPPVKSDATITKTEKQPPPTPSTTAPQATAQKADSSAAMGHPVSPAPVKTADADKDKRYRIGPGDVLDIRVFNKPTLSRDNVRVDERGMITMPLIDGEIDVKCRTENDLAHEIATLYLKYQRNPHVDVFLKEFKSQPVAVIGAVNQPGRFQLQRRIRLLELLAYAGGPAERAGRNVQLVHAAEPSLCDDPVEVPDDIVAQSFMTYKLLDTLKGDDLSNPVIRPGDVITIPEAEQVYVVGNVLHPTPIPIKEPITVSRAIAYAGGFAPDSRMEAVRIVRQKPNSLEKIEMLVDLRKINRHQAEDVPLQANDIVDVPANGKKQFIRQLMGGIAPSVSQLPVRIIP